MTVQNDKWKHVSIHSIMREEEVAALHNYVDANGMKIGPLVRVLILRELENKNVLHDMPPGYEIPKADIVKIKGKKPKSVQQEKK